MIAAARRAAPKEIAARAFFLEIGAAGSLIVHPFLVGRNTHPSLKWGMDDIGSIVRKLNRSNSNVYFSVSRKLLDVPVLRDGSIGRPSSLCRLCWYGKVALETPKDVTTASALLSDDVQVDFRSALRLRVTGCADKHHYFLPHRKKALIARRRLSHFSQYANPKKREIRRMMSPGHHPRTSS